MRVLAPIADHADRRRLTKNAASENSDDHVAPLANHVDSRDSEDIIGHTERGLLHQGRSMPKVTIKTGPTTDKVIVFPSIQSMSLFFWSLAKS